MGYRAWLHATNAQSALPHCLSIWDVGFALKGSFSPLFDFDCLRILTRKCRGGRAWKRERCCASATTVTHGNPRVCIARSRQVCRRMIVAHHTSCPTTFLPSSTRFQRHNNFCASFPAHGKRRCCFGSGGIARGPVLEYCRRSLQARHWAGDRRDLLRKGNVGSNWRTTRQPSLLCWASLH